MTNRAVKSGVSAKGKSTRLQPSPDTSPPIEYSSPLLLPTFKESPVVDYPPYATTIPEATQLFQRLSVQAHALIHYRSTPSWFIDRCILEERLFFVLSGKADFVIGEKEYSARAGDCIHLPRGVRHSARTDPHDPLEFISLRYTTRLFDALLLSDVFPLPDCITVWDPAPLQPLLEEGCRLFALRPPGWQRSLDALATYLLHSLLREVAPAPISSWQLGHIADLQRIVPALRAMQSSIQKPLCARAMAHQCGLSEEQFRRVFARTLGTSPVAYYRRMRLEKACDLLHSTNDTIESIAAQVGYQHLTSFLHAFKHLLGVSPGQYRHTSQE
jgi:AraC-like DNA-binding protein